MRTASARYVAVLLAAGIVAGPLVLSAQPAAGEYEVKAAFLYNFAQYVEWPAEAFPGTDGEFVIGVLGKDPFGPILDRIAETKTVGSKKIVVRRFESLENYTPCHILFVSTAEAQHLPAVLEKVAPSHALVVCDTEGSALKGAAINLVIEHDKIRLEINLVAAERAGLKISSKLLRLATIVGDTQGRKD
jgi:hypothetical protein